MYNVFWAAILFYIFSSNAAACSCRNLSTEAFYDGASVIVIGTIVKLEVVPNAELPTQKITIDNSEWLKGQTDNEIYASLDMTSCYGEVFALNVEHLFFLNEDGWSKGYCGGTTPTEFQQAFVKEIRAISQNQP